jgi:hypothetical protein
MWHVIIEILGWPNGIIVGNLMASVIWSSVFEWRLRVHHKRTKDHITHELGSDTDSSL